jgi:Fe-S cluster assembly iron-binding protein IscA
MAAVEQSETTVVTLTAGAATKVSKLMAEEPAGEAEVLRIAIQGGGCSGFEYALGFVQRPVPPGLDDRLPRRPSGVRVQDREPERHRGVRLRAQLPGRRGRSARPRCDGVRLRLRPLALTRLALFLTFCGCTSLRSGMKCVVARTSHGFVISRAGVTRV